MSHVPDSLRAAIEQLYPGGFTLRDEANAMVANAFRNGPIEDLHAGKHSELLDNDEISRITNDEMKRIMINACETMEKLLRLKDENPGDYYLKMMEYNRCYCGDWLR